MRVWEWSLCLEGGGCGKEEVSKERAISGICSPGSHIPVLMPSRPSLKYTRCPGSSLLQ